MSNDRRASFSYGKTAKRVCRAIWPQYYWGWRDGYWNWAFSAQKPDAFSWPNDDEGHPPNYWKGADAGMQYAKEHVMMKVVNGHVLTEYNATTHITDWFDGQSARIWGDVIPKAKSYPNSEFVAGYNSTYRIYHMKSILKILPRN